jgi:hypothetical protein
MENHENHHASLMGKSTISIDSMVIFNSFLYVYQAGLSHRIHGAGIYIYANMTGVY